MREAVRRLPHRSQAAMPRRITPFHRRRLSGRRKSTTRVGLWPVLLFVALCVLAAIAGIFLEDELRNPPLVRSFPILNDRP
jgi:hypothetical protein